MEAETFFDASFSFFWCKSSNLYYIDVHSVGISISGSRGGEGMISSFCGLLVTLRDFFSSFPLRLEMNGLGIPFLYLRGNSVH